MPIIKINLVEGRTETQKENLIFSVTEACREALDIPKEFVRIIINEVPKQNYAIGGVSKLKLENK